MFCPTVRWFNHNWKNRDKDPLSNSSGFAAKHNHDFKMLEKKTGVLFEQSYPKTLDHKQTANMKTNILYIKATSATTLN